MTSFGFATRMNDAAQSAGWRTVAMIFGGLPRAWVNVSMIFGLTQPRLLSMMTGLSTVSYLLSATERRRRYASSLPDDCATVEGDCSHAMHTAPMMSMSPLVEVEWTCGCWLRSDERTVDPLRGRPERK